MIGINLDNVIPTVEEIKIRLQKVKRKQKLNRLKDLYIKK